ERPCAADWNVRGGTNEGDVRRIVEVELHHVLRPDDSVGMEGGVHALSVRKGESGAQAVPAVVGISMHRSGILAGTECRPVFHDVGLAALGPADGVNIVAQHPKCRPESRMGWKLDAGFEAS